MKPQLLKISNPADSSFNIFQQEVAYFPTPWHYHPEIEIVFMKKSTGQKYIGSSISKFEPGDLVMIGSFLPHFYRNDENYYENGSQLTANSIVIHFEDNFLGSEFLNKPEFFEIKNLIERSKKGIQFNSSFSASVRDDFDALVSKSGIERLLAFLDLLKKMSRTKDYYFLTSEPMYLNNQVDSDRIKKVFEYVMQHFQKEIKLEDIASLAHMSQSAFSRYFKKRTRKTFSTFLTEIRIEHACKLLQQDKLNVSEISYESGFNNLSNFNRQFKTLKKTTPLNYRSRYL